MSFFKYSGRFVSLAAMVGACSVGCSAAPSDDQSADQTGGDQAGPEAPAAANESTARFVTVPFNFGGQETMVTAELRDGDVVLDDMILGTAASFGLDPETGEQLENKGALCTTNSCGGDIGWWTGCIDTPIDYCFDSAIACSAATPCPGSFVCSANKCTFSAAQKTEIRNALSAWATAIPRDTYFGLSFSEKSCGSADPQAVIKFTPNTNAGGCNSTLGRSSAGNRVNLANGCFGAGGTDEPLIAAGGIIEHEVGHAFGMIHEQSRSDRDDSVAVDSSLVPANAAPNFAKVDSDNVTTFEIGSIMEYGSWGFAGGNAKPPIVRKDRWTLKKNTCSTGSGCYGTWNNALATTLPLTGVLVGDFNADGKDDAFVPDGTNWKYSPGGTGSLVTLRASTTKSGLAVGDFDADGRRDDVLEITTSGAKLYVNGTAAAVTLRTESLTFGNLLFGDFNGDGQADIVRTNGTQWDVAMSQGLSNGVPRAYAAFTLLVTDAHSASALAVGDFDGDGKRDDVFGAFGNAWQVRLNGTGAWSPLLANATTRGNLQFGDVNADGRTDVFVQTTTAGNDFPALQVSLSGSGALRTLTTGVPQMNNVLIGNFDGSAGVDVISDGVFDRQRNTLTAKDIQAAQQNLICVI